MSDATLPAVREELRPLLSIHRRTVGVARMRVVAASLVFALFAFLLWARGGSLGARVGAGASLAVVLAGWIAYLVWERRTLRNDDEILRRVVGPADAVAEGRARRALSVVERPDAGTSQELAELHVSRTLAALPAPQIEAKSRSRARSMGMVALAFAALALGTCAYRPFGVVEGADVLVAQKGVAPVGFIYLANPTWNARPPEYLHEPDVRIFGDDEQPLARGTLLTVQGTPVHDGRTLLLSDGTHEVPFVDDGNGKVVARWPLEESANLRVLARFGEVAIEEPRVSKIVSIPDLAPKVSLEGAPKAYMLADNLENGELPIRYEAVDDHGLREVHLVLRSAGKEERRVLARLDGETKKDRGGHVLRATDPFLKKSHAPVEVRVEAKDNDPITGPKWGASDAFTIVPPDVGEPEARRLAALLELRNHLVDGLALRFVDVPKDAEAKRKLGLALGASVDSDDEAVQSLLGQSFAGLRMPSRLEAIVRGQLQKEHKAWKANRALAPATQSAFVKATERFVLVLDAIIQGLGMRDARGSAKKLADVADDLALGANAAGAHGASTGAAAAKAKGPDGRSIARMDAATTVLRGGQKSMFQLGSLGRDLGEIIEAALIRVDRARKEGDFFHAELAAKDLAARLREPDPSFGSKGGSGGKGQSESGAGQGPPSEGEGSEGNDVEGAFNEAAKDLERLAQEHAEELAETEQAMMGKASPEDTKAMEGELKKHAEAVRDAASKLPSTGAGGDSWSQKAASAREHAEQMAKALEMGDPADATSAGRNSVQSLDEAKQRLERQKWQSSAPDADQNVDEARKKLASELAWAEKTMEQLRKKARERGNMGKHGDKEQELGERAGELGDRGKEALPQGAVEALQEAERNAKQAAQALKSGDGDKALQHQREAQRQLERARGAMGDADDGKGESDGQSKDSSGRADIPKADAHKGPEEWRRRVMKGLAQPGSSDHKDAVRRYAEGLVR